MFCSATYASSEPIVMIAPPPDLRRSGMAPRQQRNVPLRLISTTVSQSATENSVIRPRCATPARWANTSSRPWHSLIIEYKCATEASSRTSTLIAIASNSCARSLLLFRSASTTVAPCSANRRAQAAPIPEAAPVTRTTFPFISLVLWDSEFTF